MKRILCIVVIVLATLLSNVYVPTKVQASSLTEDIGFEVDENLFNVQWYESYYINVYQDCHSTAKNFDKGTLLGKAKITVGVASTKAPIDNKAYQKILIKAEMLPSCVKGYDYGMSQYLKVRVSVYNKMRNVYIEPESSRSETSYTTTGTRGLAFNGGVSRNNEGMLKLNGGTCTGYIKASDPLGRPIVRIPGYSK